MLASIQKLNEPTTLIWDKCLAIIEKNTTEHNFETWFRTTNLNFKEDGTPYIEVPNRFFADFIEEHFGQLIKKTLSEFYITTDNLTYIPTEKEWNSILPVVEDFVEDIVEKKQTPSPKQVTNKKHEFRSEYTFSKFVVGDSNKMAYASCLAVAEAPGKTSFNPLTIYGGTGLGKTHLLQAIGHFSQEEGTADTIIYMTSQEFINQYLTHIREKKDSTSFYKKFAAAELLLLDDIHFFSGKPSTQKEFFRIFSTLMQQNKQIVLSSDRPPEKIPDMMEHIINRFMGGLIVDIQPPNLETRIAILQKKAEIDGLRLQPEVLNYIASTVTSNIRELEGTLIRLIATASFTGKDITIDIAKEIFGDIISRKDHRLTIEVIQTAVAEHFGISPNQLRAHTRKREIVHPRNIAMYLCKKWTKQALRTIGLDFGGRDYSSVIYACKKIESELDSDTHLRQDIDTLDMLLKPLA